VHILRDQLVTLRQERIPRTPFIHGCGERLPDLVPGVEEGVVSGLGVADEGGVLPSLVAARTASSSWSMSLLSTPMAMSASLSFISFPFVFAG
jgi:hypothetical protein